MSNNDKIKVMIVDDSVLVRKYLSQIFEDITNIEVIATAHNGKIALQKLYLMKPDIIILDIEMPEMNGTEFLKYMKETVAPEARPFVIMFSSLVDEGSSATFEALANGAADFVKKPEGQLSDNLDYLKKEFELKIKELYQTEKERFFIDRKHEAEKPPAVGADAGRQEKVFYLEGLRNLDVVLSSKNFRPELIAVGSSTGGPNAIRRIMDNLKPARVPIVIAQHMPAGFTAEFAKNLSSLYKKKVAELADGETLQNDGIYICPGGVHSRITRIRDSLTYRADNSNYEGLFFKPSVDIFFKSVLESVGRNAVGVILSGMGKDGSIESVALRRSGALVIAQNKESSVVWGMPGNSVKNGGVDIVLDVGEIGPALNIVMDKTQN